MDSSVLTDYEVWSLAASLLGSAVVGFLVAYFQAPPNLAATFLATALVFGALLLLALATAFSKRKTLTRKTRANRFRIGDRLDDS